MNPSTRPQTVLVTGGTGYIGSHACVALVAAGFEPLILDNLCNSNPLVLDRLEEICGLRPRFVEADVRDRDVFDALFTERKISAVLHFAGLKAVGESVADPERYADNNVNGTRVLVESMEAAGVRTLVFSSSATVYGDRAVCPIGEDAPLRAINPYGQTKLDIEFMLRALPARHPGWRIAILRYFNPVGAHPTGLIGEDPLGIPNNLMPYITQVAVGRREALDVFGDDYDTPDGTGVRDYIHVMDLVEGHVDALRALQGSEPLLTLNLGTGKGVSVCQLVEAFERATGVRIPRRIVARRSGDAASLWANPGLARRTLGWAARRSVEDMCRDSWNWQSNNPRGYEA